MEAMQSAMESVTGTVRTHAMASVILVVILGLVIVYLVWKRRSASAAPSAGASTRAAVSQGSGAGMVVNDGATTGGSAMHDMVSSSQAQLLGAPASDAVLGQGLYGNNTTGSLADAMGSAYNYSNPALDAFEGDDDDSAVSYMPGSRAGVANAFGGDMNPSAANTLGQETRGDVYDFYGDDNGDDGGDSYSDDNPNAYESSGLFA